MVRARTKVGSSRVNFSARHILFVEGEHSDAIDPVTLKAFFQDKINVHPLGASFYVKAAAQALFASHPDYYFIIDRDHHDDDTVERSWSNFPDQDQNNLLIWRRREFENYFIIPEYLEKSSYVRPNADLREKIREECQKRLYLETLNMVILQVREELKTNWVTLRKNPAKFPDRQSALAHLRTMPEFQDHANKTAQKLGQPNLQACFEHKYTELTDGVEPLEYGRGRWLEMVSGKKVFAAVVDRCFLVKDTQGKSVQGAEARKLVVQDLLQRDLADQPEDLRQLHRLVTSKILKS